ncbi:MAG: DNA translocase FtsK [Planctomycetes bacterium]|nr:DNA translocase FtsK [Planctomycetota bacterium]
MNKAAGKVEAGKAEASVSKKKGTHFVPIEDAPTGQLSERARELIALALCGVCLFALLSLVTFHLATHDGVIPGNGYNLGGTVGYLLAHGFSLVFGLASWVPFLVVLGAALALFRNKTCERLVVKAIGTLMFTAMIALLLAGPQGTAGQLEPMTPWGYGGLFGAHASPRLFDAFGGTGRLLLVGFGALVSFLLATEWLFSTMLERFARTCERLWRRLWRLPEAVTAGADGSTASVLTEDEVELRSKRTRRPATTPSAPEASPGKRSRSSGGENGAAGDDEDDEDGEPLARGNPKARGRARTNADDDDDDGPAPVTRGRSAPGARGSEDAEGLEAPSAAAVPSSAQAVDRPPEKVPPAAEKPPEPAVVEKPKIVVPITRPRPKPAARPKKKPAQSDLPFDAEYPFPPVELFREAVHADLGATADQLQKGGEAIAQKLGSFGIACEIVAASVGPAVTQFELRLADGIRVGKVVGFEADLAAALRAQAVRVVAPIPGKDTVGIEVPNPERQKVFMRDLLDQFGRAEDLAIPLFLGKDVAGNPIVEDLARMPHLLIAGTTGSGKSVCINAILLSVLMTRTPRQVKLILVDPKMVELQAYKNVPHLCCDVVTNMKKAPSVLQWAVDEMENRYAMLSAAGVNHIRNYNRLGQQELEKRMQREVDPERVHLPYIVIVIDEFADLMNVAQNEVEESIQRLAQKSRAVGMHVILATQRPSTEVITGIIKANLPCQIAFKVNRKIDSRVILDANGAEKLLGFGDMLYVPPGGGAMLRAQGAFVGDEEMQAVVRYLEEHGQKPDFLPDLVQTQSGSLKSMADRDELYRQAVEIILGQQRGSATLLQRALSVGYTRATRLLEMMEEDGLVGPFVGSKSREVMMTLDDWKIREEAIAAELARVEEEGDAATDAGDVGEDLGDGAVADSGEASGPTAGDDDSATSS